MIDASSGGALMNKTPEEAWKMIETVAISTLALEKKRRGTHEVAPFESTMLAKTLAEMVAMVKEIKEGQQAYTATLKQSPDTSCSKPTRHCGICSCDSHYIDESPQLQDDNMVAATQDFFESTANPPYNRQYRSQGWRDNQPIRGNPPQQQQGQQRQPYTYSQPQNNQNIRYQPPHNRQQPYPANNPTLSIDEAIRIY
ncbi:hypothetical protein PIB30_033602 [Stylosanthes scabra]|uniref:Uncharacterized protein n=1 Tax=Stylosanthes scabra TaxID=79078 RepID=A0ABU6ZB69_9FABA|nr:hypothetical protein [Stylosanthes scabra]